MKTKFIHTALLICLLTSCTQGADLTVETDNSAVPLTIASSSIQTSASTRAVDGYQALTAGSIGVFLDNASGVTTYKPQSNVQYVYGTPWAASNKSESMYLVATNANVCAYYPYDAAITDKKSVDVSARKLENGKSPLAYAVNKTMNRVNNTVSFQMKQASAWVVINFKRGDRKGECILSRYSLVNDGLYNEYKIDITDGTEKTKTLATDGMITFTEEIPLIIGTTVTRNLSIPPAPALNGGLSVLITFKDDAETQMSVTLPKITSLNRGTKYVINITVNVAMSTVDAVYAAPDWEDDPIKDSGDTPFCPE